MKTITAVIVVLCLFFVPMIAISSINTDTSFSSYEVKTMKLDTGVQTMKLDTDFYSKPVYKNEHRAKRLAIETMYKGGFKNEYRRYKF